MTSPIQQKIEELRDVCECDIPQVGVTNRCYTCSKILLSDEHHLILLDVIEKLSEGHEANLKAVYDDLKYGYDVGTIGDKVYETSSKALTAATEMLGRVK